MAKSEHVSDLPKLGRYWLLFDASIIVLLAIAFGFLFISNHAWGSWGDDSPGYIYTAGQFIHGEALVSQDPLVQSALTYFGDEKLARFTAPTHHEIISPDGWIASRYPIGLGALLYFSALLSSSDEMMYLLVPLLATGVIILTYILVLAIINTNPAFKRVIAIMSAVSVGLASLYANYAVSQPMREIPSMFFFILSFLGIIYGLKNSKHRWVGISCLFIGGMAYGYSINIRETSGVLIVPILILFLYGVKRALLKKRLKLFGIFMIGVVLVGSLSIWNSAQITAHKEKFREKDISRIAITSNFDHVQSLSFKNLYDNQGKFRPGLGGINQYWSVMQQFSEWPPFLLMALFGLIILWKRDRRIAYFFMSWIAVIFFLFSAWINPYARYILPILPALAILSGVGTIAAVGFIKRQFKLARTTWMVVASLLLISFFVSLQPSLAARQKSVIEQEQVFKALSRSDLQQVKSVAQTINDSQTSAQPPLLFIVGQWKPGLSEMIMTHSKIRTIRYPGKSNEKPPLDMLLPFLQQLSETYDMYLWYDGSANADEQRFRSLLDLELVKTFEFSFQAGVELYKITNFEK